MSLQTSAVTYGSKRIESSTHRFVSLEFNPLKIQSSNDLKLLYKPNPQNDNNFNPQDLTSICILKLCVSLLAGAQLGPPGASGEAMNSKVWPLPSCRMRPTACINLSLPHLGPTVT